VKEIAGCSRAPPHSPLVSLFRVPLSQIFSRRFTRVTFIAILLGFAAMLALKGSILTLLKVVKMTGFRRFSYHSCSLAQKTCAQDVTTSCYDVVPLKKCRKLREMEQFGQGDMLKSYGRQGSFNPRSRGAEA